MGSIPVAGAKITVGLLASPTVILLFFNESEPLILPWQNDCGCADIRKRNAHDFADAVRIPVASPKVIFVTL